MWSGKTEELARQVLCQYHHEDVPISKSGIILAQRSCQLSLKSWRVTVWKHACRQHWLTLPLPAVLFLLPFGRPLGLFGVGDPLGSWQDSHGKVSIAQKCTACLVFITKNKTYLGHNIFYHRMDMNTFLHDTKWSFQGQCTWHILKGWQLLNTAGCHCLTWRTIERNCW